MADKPKDGGAELDLESLSPDQIKFLKQQIETEVETLSDSFSSLKVALSRFEASKQSLKDMSSTKEGTPLLVPLTTALFVRGTVDDVKSVLVDIGTGYYAEMPTDKAQEYLDRRINSLKENVVLASRALTSKRGDYQAIMQVFQNMQMRMSKKQ